MEKSQDKQGLVVSVEGGRLVISIGIETLCYAAENCERFYDGEKDEYMLKVTNKTEFAKEVVRALEHEEEDGTTPIHLLLDRAFESAVENGCDGIKMRGEE